MQHPPAVPEELSSAGTGHRAGGASDSGSEGPNHVGSVGCGSTCNTALTKQQYAQPFFGWNKELGLITINLIGKLLEGSDAIPYVKPRLRNGEHLASDKNIVKNVQNQHKSEN